MLRIFRIFSRPSAPQAKERLQILLAHERAGRDRRPDYLALMHRDLLRVIGKYFEIDEDKVSVHLQDSGDISTLEVNVELPMTGGAMRHAS